MTASFGPEWQAAPGPELDDSPSRELAQHAWQQPYPAPYLPPPCPAPYPPHYLQPPAPALRPPAGGMATASMVLGILAFLLEWLGLVTLTLALLAITLGIISWSRCRPGGGRGKAIAGVILGSAGLAAYIAWGVITLGLLFII